MTPFSQAAMIGAMAKAPKALKVLGFDCAGSGCAAAVLAGDRVVARRAEKLERGQAARLMPLIAETLKEAGLVPADLDLIAVTTGPGGFTGIRIGLAAARGLALAAGIPAVGVSNFAAARRLRFRPLRVRAAPWSPPSNPSARNSIFRSSRRPGTRGAKAGWSIRAISGISCPRASCF